MNGTGTQSLCVCIAARLISKWASPATANDPAIEEVRPFCAQFGITPREDFRVLVANKCAAPVAPAPAMPSSDPIIADLIIRLLPFLDTAERARVAEAARHEARPTAMDETQRSHWAFSIGGSPQPAYLQAMDQDPNDIPHETPQELLDVLERSDADIAAGRTSPWSEVRARLLAKIDAAEAAQARRRA